jgi:hypothetical protein
MHQYYEEVAKPVLKKYLPLYNDILEKNGTGFYVGGHESFADFWVSTNFTANLTFAFRSATTCSL